MNSLLKTTLYLALVFFGAELEAEESASNCIAGQLPIEEAKIIPTLGNLATTVINHFCAGESSTEMQLSNELLHFLEQSDKFFKSIQIDEKILPLTNTLEEARTQIADNKPISNMQDPFDPNQSGFRMYALDDGEPVVTDEATCDAKIQLAAAAKNTTATDCRTFFKAYVQIYSFAQLPIERLAVIAVRKNLREISTDWDNFFAQSRSQTSLELLINSARWRADKKPGAFLPPPESQWIFIHPSLVIENVNAAPDGENTKEGILIELAGINWWQRNKWYQLSGGSLVTLYSDREKTNDWGQGIALHFGNKFTFGAVSHSGDWGFYLSLDLLEFFKDKKTTIDGYLDHLH